jgi:hypothetical protein
MFVKAPASWGQQKNKSAAIMAIMCKINVDKFDKMLA